MKIAIIGSRTITDIDISPYLPVDVDEIISGGAKGIDTIAEAYADSHKLSKHIIRPNYERYGRAAPIKRNEEIIHLADSVLIFWDGKSKGTQFGINHSKKLAKPYTLINTSLK